jgi:hypothetical protein
MPNEITPIPFDMSQLTSKPVDYQQMTPSTINRGIVDRKPKLGKNICKQ